MQIGSECILGWGAVMYEFSDVLSDTTPDVEVPLAVFDTLDDLRILFCRSDAEVKKSPAAKAGIRVLS